MAVKIYELGSESRNSSGFSTSELLKLEIYLKLVCVDSAESACGELVEKVGRGDEFRSESEMLETWR